MFVRRAVKQNHAFLGMNKTTFKERYTQRVSSSRYKIETSLSILIMKLTLNE